MRLSKRLQALYDLIPECNSLVDIGTDHGLLIIAAVKKGRCKHAYGLDIVQGPLNQAAKNVSINGIDDSITLVLSDGLKNFKHQGDVFVVAGMGAETIMSIISEYDFNKQQEVIIQSNTKNHQLREQLVESGFMIVDEVFLFDNRKPVFIIKVKVGKQTLSDQEKYLGPVLMSKKSFQYDQFLKDYIKKLEMLYKKNEAFKEEYECLRDYLSKRSD